MRTEGVDKAVQLALDAQRHKIGALYESRMVKALSEQWPDSNNHSSTEPGNEKFASATVLYADMRDYCLWTQTLSSSELSEIVQLLYSSVGDTVYLFGAHYMQFVGDGMLCIFVDAADTQSVNHGLRAVRAALGLTHATLRIDAHVQKSLACRGLPKFALGVALHSGPVAFANLDGLISRTGQTTPVGDTVSATLKLFQGEPRPTWSVAASVQTVRLVTGAVRTGERVLVQMPGRSQPMDTLEILGLV